MRNCRKLLLASAACLFLFAVARADTLVLKDGRKFTGKLITKDDKQVVFESHFAGSRMRLTFSASEVQTVTKSKLPPVTRPAVKPAAEGLDLPPEPQAPPVAKYAGSTYYRIPLHGEVGRTVTTDLLERSLADAAKRNPTVVVLDVDSPGGLIAEVEPILDSMRMHGKSLRFVVYVRKHAISSAAIMSLGAKDIYMHPSGLIGAATAFKISEKGTPMDISEKFQSIWRAMARRAAEQGEHSRLLAEAMIDRSLQLHWIRQGGKKLVKEGAGDNVICRKDRLLTLTAGESEACGLSSGTVEGYGELAKKMGLTGWTECKGLGTLLADHRRKTVKLVDEAFEKLGEQFEDNMRQAAKNDPTEYTYLVWSHNKKFTPESKRLWKQRSTRCARFLLGAEKDIKEARSLAEKFPHLVTDPKMLKRWEKRVGIIRKRIIEGTYKKSPVTE